MEIKTRNVPPIKTVGERARLGRSETRPRVSHRRSARPIVPNLPCPSVRREAHRTTARAAVLARYQKPGAIRPNPTKSHLKKSNRMTNSQLRSPISKTAQSRQNTLKHAESNQITVRGARLPSEARERRRVVPRRAESWRPGGPFRVVSRQSRTKADPRSAFPIPLRFLRCLLFQISPARAERRALPNAEHSHDKKLPNEPISKSKFANENQVL